MRLDTLIDVYQPGAKAGTGHFQHEFIENSVYEAFFTGASPIGAQFRKIFDPFPMRALAVVCAIVCVLALLVVVLLILHAQHSDSTSCGGVCYWQVHEDKNAVRRLESEVPYLLQLTPEFCSESARALRAGYGKPL